ncbi:unnamed protein product, partial [Brenthis ino]
MGYKEILFAAFLVANAHAQNNNFCIPSTNNVLCQSLDRDGSQAVCESVDSKIDCAIKLARGQADIGVFSEEEMVLLSQHQPNINRVVASIRDVSRTNEQFAFEAVAIVPASHTGGLEGLRGGRYCHPGFDQTELRWSPRVLKTLEKVAAKTDVCPDVDTNGKTAEELEVEAVSRFFGSACRPGPWSANTTIDADLRNRYQSLCSLCGLNSNCSTYTIDMGPNLAGVQNNNRHIQALECLRSSFNSSTSSDDNNSNRGVAFVAWQHARDFFNFRNPQEATSYAALCEDGSTRVLTTEILSSQTAPCSFVRQPWGGIVATTSRADEIAATLQQWWPDGTNPASNTWQSSLFLGIVGGVNARVTFGQVMSPQNYTEGARSFPTVDASSTCLSPLRWCTISNEEYNKCMWIRSAAHTLGIEPAISCQRRNNIFGCFSDIRNNTADFIAAASNYGYLTRQHFRLSPVKLIQNSRSNAAAFSRIVALLRETSASNDITRFENLRNRKACFPEFGGIAYVSFLQVAHERSIISASECDYGRAVGEFFESACAPGATDNSHALGESSYNATNLCNLCRSHQPDVFTCQYDYNNLYYGNNGTMRCLADPASDVAFVDLHNIEAHLRDAGLQPNQVRALCRNNTLALSTGINIDENCLLAFVVDSEVLMRRNDPLLNTINAFLDTLDLFFGYNTGSQLINLEMYSPLDGISNLLFKDTAVGLSEPSSDSSNEAARNYNELFRHLDSCTSAAPVPGMANRNIISIITLFVMIFTTKYVLN